MQKPLGHLVFALHSHLPFVLNHGRWPHGSDWLSEVTVECYLPLLRVLERLARDEVGPTVTINISPILAEQLASAAFRGELVSYLEQRRQICSETRRYFSDTHADDLAALCDYWAALYEGLEREFEEMNGDLLGRFRALADRGTIELISTGATHGYFPLLSRDESIDLQLRVAGATHRRHFGRAPRGLWLPECAYRPRYEWTPPVGPRSGKVRYKRRGVEELLAAHALEYFFTDIHLVRGGQALSAYRDYFPRLRSVVGSEGQFYRRENRSPYAPYRVASRGGTGDAVAFVRDPETTLQVWSRDAGYPGDEWYLEFHKRHFPGGLRFWRVTHPKSDLADKRMYVPRTGRGAHARPRGALHGGRAERARAVRRRDGARGRPVQPVRHGTVRPLVGRGTELARARLPRARDAGHRRHDRGHARGGPAPRKGRSRCSRARGAKEETIGSG